eukprot:CFRG8369T1
MSNPEDNVCEEMRPSTEHGYPESHPSIHDNPLTQKSTKELKHMLTEKNIEIPEGLVEKDDLVELAVKSGLNAS